MILVEINEESKMKIEIKKLPRFEKFLSGEDRTIFIQIEETFDIRDPLFDMAKNIPIEEQDHEIFEYMPISKKDFKRIADFEKYLTEYIEKHGFKFVNNKIQDDCVYFKAVVLEG